MRINTGALESFFSPPTHTSAEGKIIFMNNKSECELKIRGDGKSLGGTVELFLGRALRCQRWFYLSALQSFSCLNVC